MVFNDRSVYKEGHARNSSWPGELISTQRPHTFAQTCLLVRSFSLAVVRRTIHSFGLCPLDAVHASPEGVPSRPPPKASGRDLGKGTTATSGGRSPHLEEAGLADHGKESVRPQGGGGLERGTLNADRKANRKGAALFNGPYLMARIAKASSETRRVNPIATGNNDKGTKQRCYRSAHLLAFSIVLPMYTARFEVLGSPERSSKGGSTPNVKNRTPRAVH